MEQEKLLLNKAVLSKLINDIVDALPDKIRDNLVNVEFLIEERPSFDTIRSAGSSQLLGLYHGIPLNKRGRGYTFVLPDRIILYQKNIARISRTFDEWRNNVRKVVLHEIGHYFGFNEREIRELMNEYPEEPTG
ncbi:MAG TPA: metallopeptidase family protein [Atribacteraceae bacterium]|nr:metallopeptidase family protein [Atribacteraceae bacterium]